MIQLKNDYQVNKIRESCKLLAEMFETVGPQITEGISTYDVDKLCEDFMKAHHVNGPCKGYFGFPAVSCTSVNDVVIHGIPSKKKILREGDLLSLDVCIEKDGYISDSTHTYEIGRVSEEVHKLNVETRNALYRAITVLQKPGKRLADISLAVQNYINKFGYGIVRDYTGHGVGLELHEEPEVPNYLSPFHPNPRLRKGMVLAIEPMINLGTWKIHIGDDNWTVLTNDGKVSAHWEHTVVITDTGVEVLTAL